MGKKPRKPLEYPRKEMSDEKKPREWTLCYGEYDEAAWNGPIIPGNGEVKVIEKSAYDELQRKLEIAERERDKFNTFWKDEAKYRQELTQTLIERHSLPNYFSLDDIVEHLGGKLEIARRALELVMTVTEFEIKHNVATLGAHELRDRATYALKEIE